MRCRECEAGGDDQARYCTCCGRPVDAGAAVPSMDSAADSEGEAVSGPDSPPARSSCEACGGVIPLDRNLCEACERVFGRYLQTAIVEPDSDRAKPAREASATSAASLDAVSAPEPTQVAGGSALVGSLIEVVATHDDLDEDEPDPPALVALDDHVSEDALGLREVVAIHDDLGEDEPDPVTLAEPAVAYADAVDPTDVALTGSPMGDGRPAWPAAPGPGGPAMPTLAEVAAPVFSTSPAFTPAPLIEISAFDAGSVHRDAAGVMAAPDEPAMEPTSSVPVPWWMARRDESFAGRAAKQEDLAPVEPTVATATEAEPPIVAEREMPAATPGPAEAPPRRGETRGSSSIPRASQRRLAPQNPRPRTSGRQAGALAVVGAALVVAVGLGAPSLKFWFSTGAARSAAVPTVSEAELAAAVAALQEQVLTESAPTMPPGPPLATPADGPTPAPVAAPAKVTPAKKPLVRAAVPKRRPTTAAARPEADSERREPAPAPTPLHAVAIAVAAESSAPVAPHVDEPLPSGATYEVTQVDARPQVESQVAARVPDHLRDRQFEEALVLRVLVSASGRPADVRVLRRSRIDAALDAAAVTAVRQWRFSPATRRGQTVNCWVSVGVPIRGEGGAGTQ